MQMACQTAGLMKDMFFSYFGMQAVAPLKRMTG
jgi:hypothetical protein